MRLLLRSSFLIHSCLNLSSSFSSICCLLWVVALLLTFLLSPLRTGFGSPLPRSGCLRGKRRNQLSFAILFLFALFLAFLFVLFLVFLFLFALFLVFLFLFVLFLVFLASLFPISPFSFSFSLSSRFTSAAAAAFSF